MKTISKNSHHGRGVDQFLADHGADVTGVISGYDQLRLRGSLRHLYQPTFMFCGNEDNAVGFSAGRDASRHAGGRQHDMASSKNRSRPT